MHLMDMSSCDDDDGGGECTLYAKLAFVNSVLLLYTRFFFRRIALLLHLCDEEFASRFQTERLHAR